ncbi:MAG TPA: hypothetical protein VFB72_06760 [Verrucomicrobiae bacterium]|nr:hypothetical protein [Verrucomicrobiae bacterium]
MSDFKFACPNCGQHVVCDTSNAGMQIACPICQTLLTVPQPPPTAAAPAAPPTPGRLTINKTAHQSHASAPPPGAANTPAKPAWGTKPTRVPVRPKKKSPLVPIGIVCGVLAVLAIVWFAIVSPYLQKKAEQKKEAAEAAQRQHEQEEKAKREAAERKKASWKLDLTNARFPERPASGKLHGTDFTVQNAIFQSGMLVLLQTNTFPGQFIISVPLKGNETLAGKSFDIAATSTNSTQPRIVASWKDLVETKPGVETYSKGYAMKLQFGSATDGGKLTGKIYLCLPDTQQSFVAGDFSIGPKNPVAVPAGGVRGTAAPPPSNPRMPLPHY